MEFEDYLTENYKIEMLKGQISPYAAGRKVLEKYLKNNE